MSSNLPPRQIEDSAQGTKLFFDTYGIDPLEFSANEVDSATAFFQSYGFDRDASIVTAASLLKQAKLDNVSVFTLLDTLKTLDGLQVNSLIGQILNNNRPSTSSLGFRIQPPVGDVQKRNIAP